MRLIEYVPKKFRAESLQTIETAQEILEDYRRQGFTVTLRQLYYSFVSKDLIPNTLRSYKNLGTLINNARLAGLIDWEMLVDRTREVTEWQSWSSPREALQKVVDNYHIDMWVDQEYRPEIWIEKDALTGIIETVCGQLDVPYLSCRGYASQSTMWEAAQRMNEHMLIQQKPKIIHLGDHDPSGIDMSRDIKDRLTIFLEREGWETGEDWEFERIALSMDQINEFSPPPNYAKITDSRFEEYRDRYGTDSWELDALEPSVMNGLIRDAVEALVDDDSRYETILRERNHRKLMQDAVGGITL